MLQMCYTARGIVGTHPLPTGENCIDSARHCNDSKDDSKVLRRRSAHTIFINEIGKSLHPTNEQPVSQNLHMLVKVAYLHRMLVAIM